MSVLVLGFRPPVADCCSFVVEDDKYNYLSGRFPPDADLLAKKAVEMVKGLTTSS